MTSAMFFKFPNILPWKQNHFHKLFFIKSFHDSLLLMHIFSDSKNSPILSNYLWFLWRPSTAFQACWSICFPPTGSCINKTFFSSLNLVGVLTLMSPGKFPDTPLPKESQPIFWKVLHRSVHTTQKKPLNTNMNYQLTQECVPEVVLGSPHLLLGAFFPKYHRDWSEPC